MQNGINVLSLFDGMSCGQIALERAGIKVNKYYASEIDKHAMAVTMHNYPNTIQLGDVTKVHAWMLDDIDLLIGGSPCQGFSFAGKQLNFNDPRSALFFEYVRLLEEIRLYNPKVKFFLENVKMKKEYQDVISDYLFCEPVHLNSTLVSAQIRKRLYWCNIRGYKEPEDRGILMGDILEDKPFIGISDTLNTNPSGRGMNGKITIGDKAPCLTTNKGEGSKIGTVLAGIATDISGHDIIKRIYSPEGKSPCLMAAQGGNQEPKVSIFNINRYKGRSKENILKNSKTVNEKAVSICGNANVSGSGVNVIDYEDKIHYRKLTPVECERLQTVPDNYTSIASNTQRYRMLGNGWTVDAIVEFFKGLKTN